ncbi:MAG: hypothetical protein HGA86_05200 [Anaerolineaceae bacterium]|nr:hypothetical protein [Anaerolineaceae bacterium]
MSVYRRIMVACILLALLGGVFGTTQAQTSPDSEYIDATRHWISGPFLKTYHSVSDPLLIFGYPITREYRDPLTGRPVQYFQKCRMILVETLTGEEVQISPLGELMYNPSEATPAPIEVEGVYCRRFDETGKDVCYNFLKFYKENNGKFILGNPISNLETRNDRMVQYFQNGRLEWHPDQAPDLRVKVTDLGKIYFDQTVNDPSLTQPEKNNIPTQSIDLQAKAFVGTAILSSGSTQTIYVSVTDQNGNPIANAESSVAIKFSDELSDTIRMPGTNSSGISVASFRVPQLQPKSVVQVRVVVAFQGEKTTADTWFRIWW